MHMEMSLSSMVMAHIATSENRFKFHKTMSLVFYYFTATRMQELERLLQISTTMAREMLIIERASPIATHIMRTLSMEIAIIAVVTPRDTTKKCMCTDEIFFHVNEGHE